MTSFIALQIVCIVALGDIDAQIMATAPTRTTSVSLRRSCSPLPTDTTLEGARYNPVISAHTLVNARSLGLSPSPSPSRPSSSLSESNTLRLEVPRNDTSCVETQQ